MAVYKLFPEKDATLYSLWPQMNTGLDSQIETTATAFSPSGDPYPQVSRALIQFNNAEIASVLDDIIREDSGTDYKAYLRLYSSKATGLNTGTTIDIHAVAKSWEMGTGLYLDQPLTTNGASWLYRNYEGSLRWVTGANDTGSGGGEIFWTSSYITSSTYAGGAQWVYASPSSSEWPLSSSVTFNYRSSLDVAQDVTSLIYHWMGSGSINADLPNYGFLIKLSSGSEFQDTKDIQPELKFFSVDTSTIYPPQLEFRWDDFVWNTGSLSVLSTSTPYVSLAENPGTFNQDAVNRFRVYSRPEYPARSFTTSSLYTANYYLPEGSTWALKDLDTNEFVINFDNNYTKLSADSTSCYFDIYMNGLEPERYYKLIFKHVNNDGVTIFDNNDTFKIVR